MANMERRLGAVGLSLHPGTHLHGFIAHGGRMTRAIDVPADTCLTLVALSTEGVGDMDAALYTADGEVLAADAQPDAHPAIQICGGSDPIRLYYVVHAYAGAGSFLMEGFSGPRSTVLRAARELGGQPALATVPGVEPAVEDLIEDLAQGLRKRGFQPIEAPLKLPLEARQRVRVGLHVAPGRCYAVAAFGVDGIDNLELRILDQHGDPLALDTSPLAQAEVQFCAREDAQFTAETYAVAGGGSAAMLLYQGNAHQVLPGAGLWLDKSGGLSQGSGTHATVAKTVGSANTDDQSRSAHPSARVTGALSPGQVVEQRLRLDRGCYGLSTETAPSLVALDVQWTPEGGPMEREPHLCIREARWVRLRLSALAGQGRYAAIIVPQPEPKPRRR